MPDDEAVSAAESAYKKQCSRVEGIFMIFRNNSREKVRSACSGNSRAARKLFWSSVTRTGQPNF